MSVRRAQQEIDSAEYTEWLALFEMEPFGQAREDWRAAQTPFILAQVHAAKGRKPSFADYFLRVEEGEKKARLNGQEVTQDQLAQWFRYFVKKHNRTVAKAQG